MSLFWTHQIAKSLASARPSPALELHLDALLVWLSNPDNPRAAELERAIGRQRLTRADASARAYRLLDQLLFASEAPPAPETLGLVPGTPATLAKQRYRRLVQAYHPDRHPERTDWATRRTEQINRAFAALQRGERDRIRPDARQTPRRADSGPSHRRSWRLPPAWLPEALRDWIAPSWLWAHTQLVALTPSQQRLLSAAAIAIALLLAISLWPETPPKPVPRIIHHPLTVAPPAPVAATTAPAIAPPSSSPPELAVTASGPAHNVSGPRPDTAPPIRAAEETASAAAPVTAPAGAPAVDEASATPAAPAPERQPPEPAEPQTATAPQWEPARPERSPPPAPAPATASHPVEEPAPAPEALPLARSQPGRPSAPGAGADIPAANLPEPPTPPQPPQAPLALSAAAAGAPGAARCQSAPEFLHRFQTAYQNGALDQLMALYSPLAKENELATWFAIRQTYADWFRTTSARHIGFEQIQVQPIPDSPRCALMAVFQVSYLDRQSRLVTQAGIIELLLEVREADWRILRARY